MISPLWLFRQLFPRRRRRPESSPPGPSPLRPFQPISVGFENGSTVAVAHPPPGEELRGAPFTGQPDDPGAPYENAFAAAFAQAERRAYEVAPEDIGHPLTAATAEAFVALCTPAAPEPPYDPPLSTCDLPDGGTGGGDGGGYCGGDGMGGE